MEFHPCPPIALQGQRVGVIRKGKDRWALNRTERVGALLGNSVQPIGFRGLGKKCFFLKSAHMDPFLCHLEEI